MGVLFIDACMRKQSRTRRLAEALLRKLDQPYETVRLEEMAFPAMDEAFLAKRDRIAGGEGSEDPDFAPARQFAAAETIVIAAPYWDLSFPAVLKQYLEQVCVTGITFRYGADGVPTGLCAARRLYYVTTAGGPWAPDEYGFGYVKAVAQGYFGIQDVRQLRALGLDVDGADPEAILEAAEAEIEAVL